jgi:hypothetical protein
MRKRMDSAAAQPALWRYGRFFRSGKNEQRGTEKEYEIEKK